MRAIGVIGPSQSGKSTLIAAMSEVEGNRAQPFGLHGETAISTFSYMGDDWAALEVPGGHDALAQAGPVLAACDAALLCVPAQTDAAVLAAPYLRMLEESGMPTFLFINKIDAASERVADVVAALQQYCRHGIVLRQIPIRDGDEITGVIDLISERAWEYHENERSSLVELPEAMRRREQEARSELLEALADFDDALLEQIIEDKKTIAADVYPVATHALQHHELIPSFLGEAVHGHGVARLLKTLRHEVPRIGTLRSRLGLSDDVSAAACLADQVKHLGKILLIRALGDGVGPRTRLAGAEVGNLNSLDGRTPLGSDLAPGEFALAIKSDHILPGTYLGEREALPLPPWSMAHAPTVRRIVVPAHEKDESKLSAALTRLAEIDPGLSVTADDTTGAPVIGVQGQQHLKATVQKLSDVFGIEVECHEIPAALRETIRSRIGVQHRHRKQSGGAGQFADVVIEVSPGPSGGGFHFTETVKGGAVPRNYIPSVEAGARDAMAAGPSGHPVVDIAVELKDGKSHSVDSSDFAFKTAGHNAVKEALEKAGTLTLQPIMQVEIQVPSIFTGNLVQLVSSLKGQVLGFDPHPEAEGWDVFRAMLPMASEEDLSRALGSATRGTAWFASALDHYEELRSPHQAQPAK